MARRERHMSKISGELSVTARFSRFRFRHPARRGGPARPRDDLSRGHRRAQPARKTACLDARVLLRFHDPRGSRNHWRSIARCAGDFPAGVQNCGRAAAVFDRVGNGVWRAHSTRSENCRASSRGTCAQRRRISPGDPAHGGTGRDHGDAAARGKGARRHHVARHAHRRHRSGLHRLLCGVSARRPSSSGSLGRLEIWCSPSCLACCSPRSPYNMSWMARASCLRRDERRQYRPQ